METINLRKDLKYLYSPKANKVEFVQVPTHNFLMVDGAIEPGQGPGTSPLFQENMQALYTLAYTLKFMLKRREPEPLDYPVMALEGLWWVEDGNFDIQVKDNWFYTLMIVQPDMISHAVFADALAHAHRKKGDLPAFARLRLEHFAEGLAVQILHIGPYATEPESVAKMDEFTASSGYVKTGRHHEIYLGSPLRADPEKLKTILRHPVKKA